MHENLSYEYIRGLIEGQGSFSFSSSMREKADGTTKKIKIPTFSLKMHARDYDLLCKVRDIMGLENSIYLIKPYTKDGYNRGKRALLRVREVGNIKNILVPLLYNRLVGDKSQQFNDWLTNIGKDPLVPGGFKIIYRLHKKGYYKNNPKFVRNVSRETS